MYFHNSEPLILCQQLTPSGSKGTTSLYLVYDIIDIRCVGGIEDCGSTEEHMKQETKTLLLVVGQLQPPDVPLV